jgi:DNA-binding MarR family transcriptional regulator
LLYWQQHGGIQDDLVTDVTLHQSMVEEIKNLLSQLSDRFQPEENDLRDWMLANSHNPALAELMQDITLMMFRVLDAIGQLEPVNGITIAKQYGIPKGSVSKATRRLVAHKLITQEALPNNKKEILFRTTPLGKELFLAHRAFDAQMERGINRFMQRYAEDELRFMTRVLQEVMATNFLALGRTVSEDTNETR